jgi:signal peptidase
VFVKTLKFTVYGLLAAVLLATTGVGVFGWQHGYRAYAVQTGSMTPTYPTGALVIDRPGDGGMPAVGEVITFRTSHGLVTHRVHSITPDGVQTKGDANRTPAAWPTKPEHVVGVVSWGAAYLGYVLVFFQQPTGVASLALLALSVWCAWTAFFPAKEEPVVDESTELFGSELEPTPDDDATVIVLPDDRARSGLLTA